MFHAPTIVIVASRCLSDEALSCDTTTPTAHAEVRCAGDPKMSR
jgi:hypothetical protein